MTTKTKETKEDGLYYLCKGGCIISVFMRASNKGCCRDSLQRGANTVMKTKLKRINAAVYKWRAFYSFHKIKNNETCWRGRGCERKILPNKIEEVMTRTTKGDERCCLCMASVLNYFHMRIRNEDCCGGVAVERKII